MLGTQQPLPSCNHSSPVADGLLSTDTGAAILWLQLYLQDMPDQGSQDPLGPTDPRPDAITDLYFFSPVLFLPT